MAETSKDLKMVLVRTIKALDIDEEDFNLTTKPRKKFHPVNNSIGVHMK